MDISTNCEHKKLLLQKNVGLESLPFHFWNQYCPYACRIWAELKSGGLKSIGRYAAAQKEIREGFAGPLSSLNSMTKL